MRFALEALRRPRFVSGDVILGEHRAEKTKAAGRVRLDSIDLLRGVIMIVMALDHTRDFFAPGGFNSRDVTEPALFLTRWITHFCAPVFIFLAGISAFLYGTNRTTGEVSRYLVTRGCWLVLIEFTLVRVGWTFRLSFDHLAIQVIFAIGASMIVLAALIHLPRWAVATIGVTMVAGHNMFDGVKAEQFGAAEPIRNLLHQPGPLDFGLGFKIFVLYPLIPWIGVMAAGYALGPLFMLERTVRRQRLFFLGAIVTAGFVLLRATNVYGDPASWSLQNGVLATVLSFINCEKYPPSLLYLAMTLGPALMLLAAFDGMEGKAVGWITTFGRVPFFFYVIHIYLIHALALLFSQITIGDVTWMFAPFPPHKPANYGLGLVGIYAVWLAVVISLYPLCRWFADIKRRRSGWWWSYL